MVDDHEQLTRNHRGGRPGMSVEIDWPSLVALVACWRAIERQSSPGVTAPPKADTVNAPTSLMVLRKQVQEKRGCEWKEVEKANRAQLEAMLNG